MKFMHIPLFNFVFFCCWCVSLAFGMHFCFVLYIAVESEIVTLRRDSDSVAAARESFSISLGSLEEAVRSLDEATDSPTFATIGKKPAVPKRRPVSMTGKVT